MDQGKSMRMIAVIAVLMLIYAGQASASFKKCYGSCIEDCFAEGGERTKCLVKCLVKCLNAEDLNGHDPCKSRCAINQCARFGNDVDKVNDCVNKCGSGKCKHLDQAPFESLKK